MTLPALVETGWGGLGNVFVCSPVTLWPLSATQTGSGCFSCLGTGSGRFPGEEQLPEAASVLRSPGQAAPSIPPLAGDSQTSLPWNFPFLKTFRV